MKPETSANSDDKDRTADQRDSRGSTGPKTEAGKQASAQNALKLGFFSSKALLPGESLEEFTTFQSEVLQQLSPRNMMEEHLLEQYIPLAWRLRRLPEIEAGIFVRYGISAKGNQCGPSFAMVANVQQDNILGQLARYETTLRRGAFKYLELLRGLRKDGSQTEEKPVIEAEIVEPKIVRPASGDLRKDESQKEERPVVEVDTVESEKTPPISPTPGAPAKPDAPPPGQPESVPEEGGAIIPPESGNGQHRTLVQVWRNRFKTSLKAEVEPKLSEEKPHEQSSESSDT